MFQKIMIGKVGSKVFKTVMAVMVMMVVVRVFMVGLTVYDDASNNAYSVLETINEWKELNLPGTDAWKVRAVLSHQWWLGPVRPNPPLDPLEACGIHEGVSHWWYLVVNTGYTRRLLTCLKQHTIISKADHYAFTLKLWCIISGFVFGVSFFASMCLVLHIVTKESKKRTHKQTKDKDALQHSSVNTKLHIIQKNTTDKENINIRKETKFVYPSSSGDDNDFSEIFYCCETKTMDLMKEKSYESTKDIVQTLNDCVNLTCNAAKQTQTVLEVVQEETKKRKKRRKNKTSVKEEKDDMKDDWKKVCKKKKKKLETNPNIDKVNNNMTKQTNNNGNNNIQESNDKHEKPPNTNGGVTVKRKFVARKSYHSEVGDTWKEDSLKLLVRVPPSTRQYIIGPKGETINKLRKQYPNVGINVPLPQDKITQHVTLEGPKTQVTATQHDITALLKTIDAKLRKNAKRVRSNITKTHLEVSPHMRHYVVGPGGEELIRLSERYPGVRVSVPPIKNKTSKKVTIRGHPSEDVMAVRDYIKAHVDQIKQTKQRIKERIKEEKEKRKQRQEFIKQKQLKNATTRK